MKRLLLSLILTTLPWLAAPALAEDYQELKEPRPVEVAPGKVLVQQFLWHRCIHCYHLEPAVDEWLEKSKPDFVEFERVPVVWDEAQFAQSSYYGLAKVMLEAGEIDASALEYINTGLFSLSFVDKKPLIPENVLPLFKPYGIADMDAFMARLNSEAVEAQRRRSFQLTRDYRIDGVPKFVVNGRYLVDLQGLQGEHTPERLFATINRLAEQIVQAKP